MGFVTREEQSNLQTQLQKRSDQSSMRVEKECSRKNVCIPQNTNQQLDRVTIRRVNPQRVSSGSAIRSRLLHKLGISQQEVEQRQKHSRSSRRPRAQPQSESLKGDQGAKDENIESGSLTSVSSSTSSSSIETKGVSFNASVTVHPIERRTAYSQRVRDTIWTNPQEMRENTARNVYEFQVESWDWKKVVEDHEMVLFQGELVHPAHFQLNFGSLAQHYSPA